MEVSRRHLPACLSNLRPLHLDAPFVCEDTGSSLARSQEEVEGAEAVGGETAGGEATCAAATTERGSGVYVELLGPRQYATRVTTLASYSDANREV